MCRLANMLLKNQWVNEVVKEEIRKYLETDKSGNTNFPKSMGCTKSSSKRKVYSDISLPQETKFSNRYLNQPCKGIRRIKQSPKSIEGSNNKDQRGNK